MRCMSWFIIKIVMNIIIILYIIRVFVYQCSFILNDIVVGIENEPNMKVNGKYYKMCICTKLLNWQAQLGAFLQY